MSDIRAIDCEEVLRRLFEYLDAEMHGQPQQEMEQHLQRCRTCFSRLEFEKRLKGHIAALGSEPVPAEVEQRIRKVLDSFDC